MFTLEYYQEIERLKNNHAREIYLLRKKGDKVAEHYHRRAINLLSRYGLKIEDYEKCWNAQNKGCSRCHVDHAGRSLFPRFIQGTKDLKEIVCLRCLRSIIE